MRDLKELLLNAGTSIKTGGNEPFLINAPEKIWFVLDGRVEIFSTEIKNELPVGQRYYFCSIEKNQIITGMNISNYGKGWGLLAVPSNNTELLEIDILIIKKLLQEKNYIIDIVRLYETAIIKLLSGLTQDINPRTDVLCQPGDNQILNISQQIHPKKGLVWVSFKYGKGIFLDMEYVAEKENSEIYYPLSSDTWITASSKSEVNIFSTNDIIESDNFWISLEIFQKNLFLCEGMNRLLLRADELNRLRDKIIHNEKTYKKSFNELSSIFENDIKSIVTAAGDDTLLAACRLVGNKMNISIKDYKRNNENLTQDEALKEITKASRIRIRQIRLKNKWWSKNTGPLLCFLKENDIPCAILQNKNKNILYNPLTNQKKIITEEIAKKIHDWAYLFYKPFPEKILTGLDVLKFSLSSIKKELYLLIFIGLVAGALTAIIPLAAQHIINTIIPGKDISKLMMLGLALLLAIISSSLFEICRNIGLLKVEGKIDELLQSALIDRLLKLPVSFFNKYSSGDLTERTLSIFMIRKLLSGQTIIAILGILFSVFNLLILFYFSGWIALVILGVIFIGLLINLLGNYFQLKYLYPAINLEGKISGIVFQFISGISKLKVAKAEIHSFATWVSKFALHQKYIINSRKIFNLLISFNQVFPIIVVLVIFLLLDVFNFYSFGAGEFVGFNTAMMAFIYAMMSTTTSIMMLIHIKPLYSRIKPILTEKLEITKNKISIPKLKGAIEISNVSYKYSNNGPLILDKISMDIKPGEYAAVVGPSGSGKSTLLKLMLGFDKPLNGAILYDKHNLSAVDLHSVRRQFGVILQNSQLIQGDILTNIIGSKKLTFEDAWEAARLAGIDKDIEEMPMGMKTVITVGGGTFSGGQKQRILIARALASKPRIIFLDEATSALDNRSQSVVIENLEKIQSTRVVIAHRISTIIKADKIYVLDKGRIVQSGTFNKLFNETGLFRELAIRQKV